MKIRTDHGQKYLVIDDVWYDADTVVQIMREHEAATRIFLARYDSATRRRRQSRQTKGPRP